MRLTKKCRKHYITISDFAWIGIIYIAFLIAIGLCVLISMFC